MRSRLLVQYCGCILLGFWIATASMAAGCQDSEPQAEAGASGNSPTSPLAGQKPGRTRFDPQSTSDRHEASRWERLRDAISPFRARKPREDTGPEVERKRWLMGRDIRYAPTVDADSSRAIDAKIDFSVSKAAYADEQQPSTATSLPGMPSVHALPPAASGPTGGYPGQTAGLPSPNPPGMNASGIPPVAAEATEPSLATLPAALEPEPYNLCKRWLRGYPTLVDWFPKHLGPPRQTTIGESGAGRHRSRR